MLLSLGHPNNHLENICFFYLPAFAPPHFTECGCEYKIRISTVMEVFKLVP